MLRKHIIFGLLLLVGLSTGSSLMGQELFCTVNVDASRIQSDRQVFEDMEKNISEYLNFNEWTNDDFTTEERIRCNLNLVVQSRPSPDYFLCQVTLQVFRPVYNSTYETVSLNVRDVNFNFRYVAYQNLQFTQNTYTDNLTALLNYYAYLIIGFDYATFSPNGGMPYFQKAQEIVNLAASASQEKGWKSRESNRNRYWQVENLLNSSYQGFHQMLYQYHRQGLDQMENSPQQARKAILATLQELQRLHRQNPLLLLNKMFLDAKQDELVSVFTNAFVNDKKQFVEIMQDVDPSNMGQYNSVMETN